MSIGDLFRRPRDGVEASDACSGWAIRLAAGANANRNVTCSRMPRVFEDRPRAHVLPVKKRKKV